MRTFKYMLCLHLLWSTDIVSTCPSSCNCRYDEKEVQCNNNFLREIPKDLPRNTTHLYLTSNFIATIKTDDFINTPDLLVLGMSSNIISVIEPYAFNNLQHLTHLILSDNPLSIINNKTFEGLRSLKELGLSRVSTGKPLCILNGAFHSLEQLQSLKLDTSNVISITTSTFAGLRNLRYLDLSSNNLLFISPGAFQHFQSTDVNVLRNNNLPCCCSTIVEVKRSSVSVTGLCKDLINGQLVDISSQVCKNTTQVECEVDYESTCKASQLILSSRSNNVSSTYTTASSQKNGVSNSHVLQTNMPLVSKASYTRATQMLSTATIAPVNNILPTISTEKILAAKLTATAYTLTGNDSSTKTRRSTKSKYGTIIVSARSNSESVRATVIPFNSAERLRNSSNSYGKIDTKLSSHPLLDSVTSDRLSTSINSKKVKLLPTKLIALPKTSSIPVSEIIHQTYSSQVKMKSNFPKASIKKSVATLSIIGNTTNVCTSQCPLSCVSKIENSACICVDKVQGNICKPKSDLSTGGSDGQLDRWIILVIVGSCLLIPLCSVLLIMCFRKKQTGTFWPRAARKVTDRECEEKTQQNEANENDDGSKCNSGFDEENEVFEL